MDAPGPDAGRAALLRLGRIALPRPLLPDRRRPFAGRRRRLLCRRPFLDPGLWCRHGWLGCRRPASCWRRHCLHAEFASGCWRGRPTGGPVRALCCALRRRGDRSRGRRASLCRAEPDHPRAALSGQEHRRHAGSLQSRRDVDAGTGIRGLGRAAHPRGPRQKRRHTAGRPHLGLARARAAAAADPGLAAVLHASPASTSTAT